MLTRTETSDIAGLSEIHTDVLHDVLYAVKCEGFDPGDYDVEMDDEVGGWVSYSISASDSRTLRAFDRVVREIVLENRSAVSELEDAFEGASEVAFDALLPALASGDDGIYEVEYDATTVTYDLSPKQAGTLCAYHRLLFRIYREGDNRRLIDTTVALIEQDIDDEEE